MSVKCEECQQQHHRTLSHSPMSINQLSVADVFMSADMKMLRMLVGCQESAACHNFCPMCFVTRDDIQPGQVHSPIILPAYEKHNHNRRRSFPPRTTQSQHDMYNLFCNHGHGNISVAKNYGNVIHPPLISTEIHQHLAPLPLHVLLGTTKKAMDIVASYCEQLDDQVKDIKLPIPSLTSSSSLTLLNRTDMKNSIRLAINTIGWSNECIHQCNIQQQHLEASSPLWLSFEQVKNKWIGKRKEEEQILCDLEEKWLSLAGYFTRLLDDTITGLKVKRQRYHGGAFVGNDCIRLLDGRQAIADVLKPQSFESLDGKQKHVIGSLQHLTKC